MSTIGFKTDAAFESSHLQGYVTIPYHKLVEIFGPENSDGDGYKVQAEWSIKFADGIYATIYDWKEGDSYLGHGEGKPKEQVTEWHIGGSTHGSVTRVLEVINYHREGSTTAKESQAPVGKTFEEAMAASKPMKKPYEIDMGKFRDLLSTAQNTAVDIVEAIQNRDGTVPQSKLIEYTCKAAEARVLSSIIRIMDACKV